MNQRITTLLGVGLLALTTGCAGSYSLIRPASINSYTPGVQSGPIEMSYQFDALRQNGRNKKYVKKEAKYGYHVVAVRIKNNWDREINFTRDLNLLYGERSTAPVPAAIATQDIRQGVPIYLLYILLNINVGGTTDPRTGVTSGGTFLPTGPFIAGGNMLVASGANSNLRKEFTAHDLTNRVIRPGETVYGILPMRESFVAPMRLELRPSGPPPPPPAAPASALPPAPTEAPAPTMPPR